MTHEQAPAARRHGPPVRPRQLSVQWERVGDHAELVNRRRDWATGGFLMLWLTGWTVGCVFLVGLVIAQPNLFSLLFAIPFWASWVFVASIVAHSFCQRERLVLDRSGVDFRRDVVICIHSRQAPLAEIKRFVKYERVTDNESGSKTSGIEMQTLGASLRLIEGVRSEELDWLLWDLNEHLRSLGVVGAVADQTQEEEEEEADAERGDDEASRDSDAEDEDDDTPQTLALGPTPYAPPSDCRWQRAADPDDFDAIVFEQRGQPNWSGLGGLLFVNLFWNGIVSVFVLGGLCGMMPDGNNGGGGIGAPGSIGWWGLFFFLIPFEVIGLLMFAGLVAVFCDPYRRTQWRFTQYDVTARWRWFGLVGRTWRYPVEQLNRIELRPARASQFINTNAADSTSCYALVLVDRADTELTTISGLTEGEARWMGDTLLRERKAWFTRR